MTVTGTISSEFSIDGSSNVVSQARARHPAAGRGHPGIQGRHRRLRRADRPHRRRQREPRAQERHQPLHGAGVVSTTATTRDRKTSSRRSRNNTGKTIARLQPVRRHRIGPDLQEQDLLHGVVREAAGRHGESFTTSVPTEKMRNGDFSELLAAGVQIYNPLTARARRTASSPAIRSPGNIIPHEPAEPDRAQHAASTIPLPNQAGQRRPAEQLLRRSAVDLRLQLPDGARRSPVVAANRTYGRWLRNFRREERLNFAGLQNGVNDHAGRHGSLQPELRVRPHGGAVAVDGSRPQGQLAAVQRRPQAARAVRPGDSRIPGVDAGAVRRLPVHPAVHASKAAPAAAGTVATLGAQQSGFNTGRAQPFYNVQFAPTLTWTKGEHTMQGAATTGGSCARRK